MNETIELLVLEMKKYVAGAQAGNIDTKLGATIRQHTLEVEKAVKAERKAQKEAVAV